MKYLLTLALLCAWLRPEAQIQVGGLQLDKNSPLKIARENFELLRQTTTLFVLQDKDYDHLEDFDKAIRSAWKIAPYKIIRRKELGDYTTQAGYSFFTLEGASLTGGSRSKARLFYSLWMVRRSKKGRYQQQQIGQIVLHPDIILDARLRNAGFSKEAEAETIEAIYSSKLRTWGAGYLREYLREMNRLLELEQIHNYYQSYSNDSAMAALQRDTLYIPAYLSTTLREHLYQDAAGQNADDDKMGRAYDFPVRIISDEDLNALLMRTERPINYIVYTQSSIDKFVNIFNTGAGGLIYSA